MTGHNIAAELAGAFATLETVVEHSMLRRQSEGFGPFVAILMEEDQIEAIYFSLTKLTVAVDAAVAALNERAAP